MANAITEEQIRPADLMAAKAKHVVADRNYLLDQKSQWVAAPCPACEQTASTVYGSKDGFQYVQCDECETVYTNPRPSLELLHDFYRTSENYAFWNEHIFPATEETRRERIFRPRAERLADICHTHNVTGGTFLEIGAAFGTFCQLVSEQNLFDRVIALEPTTGLAQSCRQRGLETREEFVEQLTETNFADAIAAFEVLEHLFHPGDFVNSCHRVLKPGGLLVLSCPNVKGFDVQTLGMESSTFDHEHQNYFHPKSLSLLLTRCGFDVLQVATPGRLDAELVRSAALDGRIDLSDQPFLNEIILHRFEQVGESFQDFLAENNLSSHMWIVGRKQSQSS